MRSGLISTPTEMRAFLGSDDSVLSHLVSFSSEFEPIVRQAVDDIFQDMQYVGGEPDLERCYLETIEEPLRILQNHGVGLLAIASTGKWKQRFGDQEHEWTRTYFLVVPLQGYFRIQVEGKSVHQFRPSCNRAMSDVHEAVTKQTPISVWLEAPTIVKQFEQAIPWCQGCCFEEIVTYSRQGVSVKPPELQRVTSVVVERALADAEALLRASGASSALDRVHTALHGYMKTLCSDSGIEHGTDASLTALFGLLRQSHPALKDLGIHGKPINQALRGLATILDGLNSVRNSGSLAHPNEEILLDYEAVLFINASRTFLHYMEAKLSP